MRPADDLTRETLLNETPLVTAGDAPMWETEDFVPGQVADATEFWEDHILPTCTPDQQSIFRGWLGGVSVLEFVNERAEGNFQGHQYRGVDLTPVELPNHVPEEYNSFMDSTIAEYTRTGVVVPWSQVADISAHPKPRMVMGMGVETSKPRATFDARYLNLMMKDCPFAMDGVGKIAQCAWKGAFQMKCDHKAGFHNIPIAKESWQYFGFKWGGVYYVFTTLCFGWKISPFIYHSLSEAVAGYLRTKGIPVLTWIDDFYFTNFQATRLLTPSAQLQAARVTGYIVMSVFYKAGYFMSISKCELEPTTSIIFLGVRSCSERQRFTIPEDKLAKLEQLISTAITEEKISFPTLEKVAGKCTSMSVACPAALLYTHFMYKEIGAFQRRTTKTRKGGKNFDIVIAKNGGLRFELDKWLEVRARMNGAPWHKALHQRMTIRGSTDASKAGWGGLVRCPGFDIFRAAGDFPTPLVISHINVQEAYALQQVLNLFCEDRPKQVQGTTVMVDVDNTVLFHTMKRGRAKDDVMHKVVSDLFWLQVRQEFTLKLQWVASEDNAEADDLSRPDADQYVRLEDGKFAEISAWVTRDFDMDLMATPASVQRHPVTKKALPFYSRFRTEGCAGVDVLGQDLGKMAGSTDPCFGFCFPPTTMVGVVLQRLAECRAHAVIIVPDVRKTWYPLLEEATVRSTVVARQAEESVFYRMDHRKGKVSFRFRRWAMRAVEALRTIRVALMFVMNVIAKLLLRVTSPTDGPSEETRNLITVSPIRARVLCSACLGQNDEWFRFCQYCGQEKVTQNVQNMQATLEVDEQAITDRFSEFRNMWDAKASQKSRSATSTQFGKFLSSRKTGRLITMAETHPQDVVQYLCWMDATGARRRTIVHARHCEAVGTSDLSGCSTMPGECNRRYAHESMRTNHVSKLGVVFDKELGMTSDWNNTLKTGNPVRSDLVAQYMAFKTEQQKRAGVLVKQAPAMLSIHLVNIVTWMQARLKDTSSSVERLVLARDIAFLTVAFSTTKRGAELTHTLVQRILRLPNQSGLMFNFQWGKTQRDGADHILTIPYDMQDISICPVRAVEQFVKIANCAGWDMTKGYLFPAISEKDGVAVREKTAVTTQSMSQALKMYATQAGETQDFSLHSLRSGGAISRALAGDSLSSIMQKAYWKNPKTAWRYMRLMEVVAPGSGGEGMVQGVTVEQYRELNEFSLSEQSRHLAAFGNSPML